MSVVAPHAPAPTRTGLAVDRLSVSLPRGKGRAPVPLVRDVSFAVAGGESLGLVGESGAGKSLTCYAAMGLAQHAGLEVSGDVRLGDERISGLGNRQLRRIRGERIAIVFQEPSVSLDPAFTIGSQIAEVVRWHRGGSRSAARRRAVECLRLVGVPNADRRANEYPHTLSGGLRQRAMIALAIACDPEVLIADEATTALDVTIQAQILGLLRDLRDRLGMALVIVTHDLGVVADSCDRVAVMYGGQIVESGPVDAVFESPQHPYTQGLLDAVPSVLADGAVATGIPGIVPAPTVEIDGCRFAARCSYATDTCRTGDLELVDVAPDHATRCGRIDEISLTGVDPIGGS